MWIYLDSCSLNRVFDDQRQPRIHLEASAMLAILAMIEQGAVGLISSEVLEYEAEKNPFPERAAFVRSVLLKAGKHQVLDDEVVRRAKEIEMHGIRAVDSLHIACAEAAQADWLVTCDDRILKRNAGLVKAVSPVYFVLESSR